MKTIILVALAALSLSVRAANADTSSYSAPSQNYQQNNWTAGGGG